jgi:hypothetical protein
MRKKSKNVKILSVTSHESRVYDISQIILPETKKKFSLVVFGIIIKSLGLL